MWNIDPGDVVVMIFVAVLGAPAAMDRLERAGKLPGRIQEWWLRRAEAQVQHHQRQEALTRIAAYEDSIRKMDANVEDILKMVRPNSGSSVYDMAKSAKDTSARIEVTLNEHISKCDTDHEALFDTTESALQADRDIYARLNHLEGRIGRA